MWLHAIPGSAWCDQVVIPNLGPAPPGPIALTPSAFSSGRAGRLLSARLVSSSIAGWGVPRAPPHKSVLRRGCTLDEEHDQPLGASGAHGEFALADPNHAPSPIKRGWGHRSKPSGLRCCMLCSQCFATHGVVDECTQAHCASCVGNGVAGWDGHVSGGILFPAQATFLRRLAHIGRGQYASAQHVKETATGASLVCLSICTCACFG